MEGFLHIGGIMKFLSYRLDFAVWELFIVAFFSCLAADLVQYIWRYLS